MTDGAAPARRFLRRGQSPAPPAGWRVEDATGQPLAYVYGDDRPQGASSHVLTVDQARRIALGIARLPDLLTPTEPETNP